MRLIINASNVKIGGGIQVALSMISELRFFPENEYHVFSGPEVISQLNTCEFRDNFQFYQFLASPSSPMKGIGIIRRMKKLEKNIQPDCVLTIFGPSYWTPRNPHISGFAKGYYLYPESVFFNQVGMNERSRIRILRIVHRYFFRQNADYYYVETVDAQQRLSSFLNKKKEDIFVIGNCVHPVFNKEIVHAPLLPEKQTGEIRLLVLSSYYTHKNLDIIREVILQLNKKSHLKFIFVLTIDPGIFERKFSGFEDNILNLGPVPIELCPVIYHECDFFFLPTLIEIFTVSYLEAMKMKKPILTSDLSFAHTICGDAAEYFDPLDAEEIAERIQFLALHKNRQDELKRKGEMNLLKYDSSNTRTEKLLSICSQLCTKKKLAENVFQVSQQ